MRNSLAVGLLIQFWIEKGSSAPAVPTLTQGNAPLGRGVRREAWLGPKMPSVKAALRSWQNLKGEVSAEQAKVAKHGPGILQAPRATILLRE